MSAAEAEQACRELVTRFIRALDGRDYDTVAASFAAEGIWDRGGEELVGPAAVRAAMDKRPADLETQHLISNMVVDVTTDADATVRYTLSAYAQLADQPYHLHGIFRATDRLAKKEDGWRFSHRTAALAFSAQG